MRSIEDNIAARIRRKGKGWAFSQHDIADIGSRAAVDLALHRLVRKGVVRRVARGIYLAPKHSEFLGKEVGPDIHKVAEAISRKFGWHIQPGRAAAENALGLTTQVPAHAVYLSDGPTRAYQIGATKLQFKRTAVKEAGFRYPESALIVQALRSRGKQHVGPKEIEKIRAWLPLSMRRKILADTRASTDWVYAAIKQVCREEKRG